MSIQNAGEPAAYAEAARTYRDLALAGCSTAMSRYAFLLREGLGVPESLEEAAWWYGRAARQGDSGALYEAGEMAERLAPIPLQHQEIVALYEEAARAGDARAVARLELESSSCRCARATGDGTVAGRGALGNGDLIVIRPGVVTQFFIPDQVDQVAADQSESNGNPGGDNTK
jgi:TPR repeat protein